MTAEPGAVDRILWDLLRYEEVGAAVALSREGLVIGCAGVARQDAELAGALGASLVGVAQRTAQRLGAGAAGQVNVGTAEGMIHIQPGDDVALLVFADRCNAEKLSGVVDAAVRAIGAALHGS